MDFIQYLTLANTVIITMQSIAAYFYARAAITHRNNSSQIYRTTVVHNV